MLAQRLPIAQFPAIAPPEIVVTTNYVGADALTIESAVATPIEEAMAGVEGMLYMRSFNANDGTMKLRVDFDLNMDPNVAEVFSEIRVNRALPQLPDAESPRSSTQSSRRRGTGNSPLRQPATLQPIRPAPAAASCR